MYTEREGESIYVCIYIYIYNKITINITSIDNNERNATETKRLRPIVRTKNLQIRSLSQTNS